MVLIFSPQNFDAFLRRRLVSVAAMVLPTKRRPPSFCVTILLIVLPQIFLPSPRVLADNTVSSTIERSRRNQLISSLPPASSNQEVPAPTNGHGTSQKFIASPSGRYAGLFVRQPAGTDSSGRYAGDYCYIQIVGASQTMWESECTPISTMNTCSLVFSDFGLEIYDGSRSAWDTNIDGVGLETLRMVDNGDLQIRDQGDQVSWKASDDQSTRSCGSLGSPGVVPNYPPYVSPEPGSGLQPSDQPPPLDQPYGRQPREPFGYRQPSDQPDSPINQRPYSSDQDDRPSSSMNRDPLGSLLPLMRNPLGNASPRTVISRGFSVHAGLCLAATALAIIFG